MPGDGCLVAWVIDRGKPLARAVGPVVAEPGPSAACVLLHDETVGHRAFVDHADLCAVAGDVERDIYLAALVLRGNTSAVHVDRTHRKAINEVEAYSLQTGGAPQRHHDIAVDVGAVSGSSTGMSYSSASMPGLYGGDPAMLGVCSRAWLLTATAQSHAE